jgi:Ca-activated chloride channel family protein
MRSIPGWALSALAVSAGAVLCAQGSPQPQVPGTPSTSSSSSSAPAPLQSQSPLPGDIRAYRSHIEVISVTATVLDTNGKLVTDLPKEAFEVYEDGVRRAVSQFTHERVPVSLGLLLDASDSMWGQRIADARAAVQQFLAERLDASDEFFVMSFNHNPKVLTKWTTSAEDARAPLEGLKPSGSTAIYDAIHASLPLLEQRAKPRAALLVISDGADTASDTSLQDLRKALLRSDVFVYAIAIDPPGGRPINRRVNLAALQEITDGSGGRTELVRDSSELPIATARIAEELNHQYLIGYDSTRAPDGDFHSIRVRIKSEAPGGPTYRVRARHGYIADPVSRRLGFRPLPRENND